MKLCGIFIVWDDWDWLELSLNHHFKLFDEIIIVWSSISNYGEQSPRPDIEYPKGIWIRYVNFEPDLKNSPRYNETLKRNIGLDWARKTDCTHFLMLDADEFYTKEDILKGKEEIENHSGLVCRSKVYFKKSILTIGFDTTLVPFLHKLTSELQFKMNDRYPFSWTTIDRVAETYHKRIRIDPTRQMNLTNDVIWSEVIMHHFSWIRKDIKKKIRNSTARVNIERSTILQDYLQSKEGYFCQFYGKILEACSNQFNLPEIIDTNVEETQ